MPENSKRIDGNIIYFCNGFLIAAEIAAGAVAQSVETNQNDKASIANLSRQVK